MLLIIGAVIVIASVLGGYVLHGGNLLVLWQPTEILIIGGAAVGSFIIANPLHTIKEVAKGVLSQLTGSPYNKSFYMDLLSLMYEIFDKSRKQGVMAIEEDIDNPESSQIFSRYPAIIKSKYLLAFITDYLRIISSGNMATHELEGMMENEIESRQHELEEPAHAVNKIADALPGLGIVAAVLGIVITMNFLSEGPERIGLSVAAALVGTFLGIWMGYGFVGPTSIAMEHTAKYEIKAYECAKSAIVATVSGQAPQMAIEFGRKALPSDKRPGFQELNDHVRSK
ncbi:MULTISPECIES: flagellar motor stator protein MotA [Marinobacter]|jgi:chemotaxis protein MotA|uniref:Chemotaxis protein MotA n=1 Tax=Marinobacter salarius TaxID=1420917 RepID=A0A1W6K7Q2_9GAMM|nr:MULTISPECIES: flagellar motor stator protein MotA [Marinobacter]ARM83421.1 motility protein A [Marinobacter salarius]AZR42253.1 motility protein [Marinobacter salarius]KXJ43213.1 MAG: flagellar motor stator protein MotA [Marinobacter sp. Hex_13]MAB51441.1 flagellar motor stator protein MotA [Marinobacter sp.]MBL85003.1 flagellar motor stator protein MotA [Marinobacter sp.]|tara:strand:+ start:1020 stop:1871 length:852 start_codon:yes stop_codon:yes gene_type:complete